MTKQNDDAAPAPSRKNFSVPEEALKGVMRTRFDSPHPTAAQLARRERNNEMIRGMGLPVLASLPVLEDDAAMRLRTPREVAERCVATTFCAIKGETKDQELVDSLIADYAASATFSPVERQFIQDPAPPKQDLIDFCWR